MELVQQKNFAYKILQVVKIPGVLLLRGVIAEWWKFLYFMLRKSQKCVFPWNQYLDFLQEKKYCVCPMQFFIVACRELNVDFFINGSEGRVFYFILFLPNLLPLTLQITSLPSSSRMTEMKQTQATSALLWNSPFWCVIKAVLNRL